MPEGNFLDANVILYVFEEDDQRKRAIARAIINSAKEPEFCISFQVVQEVLNNVVRNSPRSRARANAARALEDILNPLWRVQPSSQLYESALRIVERYEYSFYDSLIIAAALDAGCDRLLTEDMQHGQRIEGLVIENPFRDI